MTPIILNTVNPIFFTQIKIKNHNFFSLLLIRFTRAVSDATNVIVMSSKIRRTNSLFHRQRGTMLYNNAQRERAVAKERKM